MPLRWVSVFFTETQKENLEPGWASMNWPISNEKISWLERKSSIKKKCHTVEQIIRIL